jgi:hypothetical protein
MESVDDIVRVIEAAFAGVPRGRIALHEAEVIDGYGTAEERQQARELDPEQDWRDVPGASIEECPDALSYLDPVGWRFYLPAYMRWALQHLKASHNAAIDHAIYSLDCGESPPSAVERSIERFRTLNRAQAQAVHGFLTFASQNDDTCDSVVAQQALDRYWSRATIAEPASTTR